MKVLKFGGTSVGSVENIRSVVSIIKAIDGKCVVVLSAMSGTTNTLEEVCKLLEKNKLSDAINQINNLKNHYLKTAINLLGTEFNDHTENFIIKEFKILKDLCLTASSANNNIKSIIIRGEFITCQLFVSYFHKLNTPPCLINVLDFIKTDKDGHPDYLYINTQLNNILNSNKDEKIYLTQGYACRDYKGDISNLGRGGSDYTATIIGSTLDAEEIQIWTDIDGLHNNDPRYVDNKQAIEKLSYEEAEELAYFGAKILHPTCILPVKKKNIPILLKDTCNPNAKGTYISSKTSGKGVKALAAKDGIIAIKVKSGRMMLAYGFLKKVFEVFETYKTPVDMITTSEVTVSVTIDDKYSLNEITSELSTLGEVEVYSEQSIICAVGDFRVKNKGIINQLSNGMKNIPIRMVSYGVDSNNITFLIDSRNKLEALNALSTALFN